jgi:uncharacterized protein
MKKLSILLLIIYSFKAIGQTISPENRIVVIGMAEVEIPADRVVFQVSLATKEENDVKKAYDSHKRKELNLLSFLSDLKIPNKNINYTLINISKRIVYEDILKENTRKTYYETSQTVTITIDSLKKYSPFILKLIDAGFDDVSTSFTSSRINNFHDKLLEKAIEMAKKKAQVMAKSSNRELGRIVKIMDTEETDPNFNNSWSNNSYEGRAVGAGGSYEMISIPQSVTKSISVKVIFELK